MSFSGSGVEGLGDMSHRLWVSDAKLVPLGRYWCKSPLVFSLVPQLPGVVGRGEVKGHARGFFEQAIVMELGAVVGRDGTEPLRVAAHQLERRAVEFGHGACAHFAHEPPADARPPARDSTAGATTLRRGSSPHGQTAGCDGSVCGELMLGVTEARVVIEDHRRYHNEVRPHGGIGYRTPAQAFVKARALATKLISSPSTRN